MSTQLNFATGAAGSRYRGLGGLTRGAGGKGIGRVGRR
jgi:hypothetical protein